MLTAENFGLDALTIAVSAGHSKYQECDTMPLRHGLTEALGRHLSGNLPLTKAFLGGRYERLTDRTAERLR